MNVERQELSEKLCVIGRALWTAINNQVVGPPCQNTRLEVLEMFRFNAIQKLNIICLFIKSTKYVMTSESIS